MFNKILIFIISLLLRIYNFLRLRKNAFLDKLLYILGLNQILIKQQTYSNLTLLHEAEVKVFSQNGEDGILDYIRHQLKIDIPNFIEIGVGNYRESNTRFIYNRFASKGIIIDCETNLQKKARYYVKEKNIFNLWKGDLKIVNSRVTSENINSILEVNCNFNVDIFSMDIDSVDYWIISKLRPNISKIFVAEYNSVFGSQLEITVPDIKDFDRKKYHYSTLCYGMSLKALINLMKKKNYYFIGTNILKNNAFFVSNNFDINIFFSQLVIKPLSYYVDSNLRESRDKDYNLNFLSGKNKINKIKDCIIFDLKRSRHCKIKDLI
jgi:hypothetical protein